MMQRSHGSEDLPCIHSKPLPPDLTECIYQLVLESQLPHKIVSLLSTITNYMIIPGGAGAIDDAAEPRSGAAAEERAPGV